MEKHEIVALAIVVALVFAAAIGAGVFYVGYAAGAFGLSGHVVVVDRVDLSVSEQNASEIAGRVIPSGTG